MPLILGQDKKKLSKRDAATSVMDYQKEGYLAEALCMYLLRLGWAYKDQEIFTQEEIFSYFKLEDVHHAGAIFDINKLLSVNQYFIKKMSIDTLYEIILKWNKEALNSSTIDRDKKLMFLYQSRISTFSELIKSIDFINSKPAYNLLLDLNFSDIKKNIILFHQVLESTTDSFDIVLKNEIFKSVDKSVLYKSIRYAILGVIESPSIIEIMTILKKEEVLHRLSAAVAFLESNTI